MTEMTMYQQPTQAVSLVDYQTRAVQRLGEWVQSADAAFAVAQRLVQSSFVPAQYRPKGNSPEALQSASIEATAAVLAGLEVGLSPMASLRAFDNIQGTAAPKAITLRAIVQSFGHSIVLVESTATRCKMKGRRRGDLEWQNVSWTIDRAKDMGLVSKDNWKKQPGAMLVARATGEIARLIAADAILGIGYTAEEIADGADVNASPLEVAYVEAPEPGPAADGAPAGTRRMSRPKPAPKAEPAPDPTPDPDVDMITKPQLAKIAACMRDAQMTDRDDALAYVRQIVGREDIDSRNDLTKEEASQVIDRLEADLAAMADDTGPSPDEQAEIREREKAEAGL